VVAEAGDTIILGGLIKEEDTIKTQKTPVLGDIPFLKYLFSQKTKEKVRSELVIMLTVEGVENAI
ncbi:MAG TPA: pilus (MSHA type) biogenesis protein MshL, partial [Candidatus Ratteibacteria bacterium]|nr:pilus (MSHA type) biogenesis protein MshL [Candidatus Ratteibacteria bacterium]